MKGTMTTSKKGFRVAKDVKEQILKRVREEGVPVSQVAKEHGVSDASIYTWLTKGATGNPTRSEIAKLKRENKALLELVGEMTLKLSETQKKS